MNKSTWTAAALLLASYAGVANAQSYYDLAAGIVQQGQAEEAQIWNAYNASLQAEQNLYQAAMRDPRVQARYREYLAAGGNASFAEYAAYYVRTAGGNPAAYRRYIQRTSELNARDRQAINDTQNYIHDVQTQIMNERSESMRRYTHQTGEMLNGSATFTDGNYNYEIPTTLNYGQWSRDSRGNYFTVDRNNNFYRWTNWGWQPLNHVEH